MAFMNLHIKYDLKGMREEKQIPKDHLDKGIILKCTCISKLVYNVKFPICPTNAHKFPICPTNAHKFPICPTNYIKLLNY
jgi:hypothetical protein